MRRRELISQLVDLAQTKGWGRPAQLARAIVDSFSPEPDPKQVAKWIPKDWTAANGESIRAVATAISVKLAGVILDSASPAPDASSVRLVVLTALPLEAAAVESFLTDVEDNVSPIGTVYRVGVLKRGERSIRVAVVQAREGNSAAAIETERALAYFSPEATMFVGIAGGLKAEVAKGDVIIADLVYDYSGGKDFAAASLPRIREFRPGYRIFQRALAVAASSSWKASVATQEAEVDVFLKPIAAGPRLIASLTSPVAIWIKKYCGDAIAVEMEGFGYLQASFAHVGVEALVVRGISDLVDDKSAENDIEWQPIAAQNAAAFAMQVAIEMLP